MSYTIYLHRTPSNKVYIGMTKCKNLNARWKNGNGYATCRLFNRAIEKYGWENIQHEILYEGLTREEAEAKEIEMIEEYRSRDPKYGYNIENGGYGVGKHSEETLRKMSENRKGKCVGKDNPFYGKHHPPEWIKSHLCGESNPMYGLKGEKHHNYGMKHTEEALEKMRAAKIGKYTGATNPKARRVLCVETDQVFECIKDASAATGAGISSISSAIHGSQKTAGGYHWRLLSRTEQP